MVTRRFVAILLAVLPGALLGDAAADGPTVTVLSDADEVEVGQPFTLRIRAEGRTVGEVRIPTELDGLTIDPRPRRNFASMVLSSSGGMTTVLERDYSARALRPGTHTLPPLEIEVDGAFQKTEAIAITAVARGEGARADAPVARPHPPENVLRLEDVAYVETRVDKREAYEGEPILLTLELGRLDRQQVDIQGIDRGLMPPTTEGFYAIPRLPVPSRTDEAKTRNGHRYRVTQYHQILFPTESGRLTVGAWDWYGTARIIAAPYGIRYEDLALSAPAIEIRVKPLPHPKPEGFRGAVGRFTLHGEVSPRQVDQGMAVKLLIRVIGEGNPDAIGEPVIPAVDGAQVGEPAKEVSRINDRDGLVFEKSFNYPLAATEAGDLHIPPVTFTYFDPAAEEYRTESVGPFEVEVLPTEEPSERVIVDADTPYGGMSEEDEVLRAMVTDPGVLRPMRGTVWTWGLLYGSPPLAYALLTVAARRHRRFANDEGYARSQRARGRGRRRLDAAPQAPEPAEALYHALTGYLADKCGVPEAGLTSYDAGRLLEARAVEPGLAEGYLRILRACERARFGGGPLSAEEVDAMTHAAYILFDRLERDLSEGAS